jgi:acyl-CoA reductase-like NAD-dependent aldehyde dehydrogenase
MAFEGHDVRPFFVNGEWSHGSGSAFESINPADGSVAAVIAEAVAPDVDAAVQAAQLALERSLWRDLKPHERARLLAKFADAIDQDRDGLAHAQMADNGKTVAGCRSQASARAGIPPGVFNVLTGFGRPVGEALVRHPGVDISTPFGGVKASGLGREKGIEGMRVYMAQKSIYLGLNERPIAWP